MSKLLKIDVVKKGSRSQADLGGGVAISRTMPRNGNMQAISRTVAGYVKSAGKGGLAAGKAVQLMAQSLWSAAGALFSCCRSSQRSDVTAEWIGPLDAEAMPIGISMSAIAAMNRRAATIRLDCSLQFAVPMTEIKFARIVPGWLN